MSLLKYLKGPSIEELMKYFEGRPNDLLMISCEERYFEGITLAFEMGATLNDQLKRNKTIFLRLLFLNVDPILISKLRSYLNEESAPPFPEMTSACFLALFALANNGLDLNKLLENYYILIFDAGLAKSVLYSNLISYLRIDDYHFYLHGFESVSHELQAKALYAAAKCGNIVGINYLMEKGGDIHSNYKALFIAILNSAEATAELLIENGANLYNALDYYYKRTASNKLIKSRKLSVGIKDFIYRHVQQNGFLNYYYLNAQKYENQIFMELFRK